MVAFNNQNQNLRPKFLQQILEDIVSVPNSKNKEILEIAIDSRKVVSNSCFFSLQGARENGSDYIKDAISKGAIAIISDDTRAQEQCVDKKIPLFIIPRVKNYLGIIAKRFYDDPSQELTLIGITGTNGKTSIAYLLKNALEHLKKNCLYIGTLGAGSSGLTTFVNIGNTTPDIFTINSLLRDHLSSGTTHCALEVSSIGLDQNRLQDLNVDVAVFSNLSQDHLDYHGNFRNYEKAKAKLFEFKNLKSAVINIDDRFGHTLAESLEGRVNVFPVSLKEEYLNSYKNVVGATNLNFNREGCSFDLLYKNNSHHVRSGLLGRFNVLNLVIVAACLVSQNIALERVAYILSLLINVPGRMENCGSNSVNAPIYIDYAHTPDALENALTALRTIYPKPLNKLHLVFGCGGNRDSRKRPYMGAVAEQHADSIILTSDNPRNEDPIGIVKDILRGVKNKSKFMINLDRERAIDISMIGAKKNSVILIAGKGHEEYQDISANKKYFSDKVIVKKILEERR